MSEDVRKGERVCRVKIKRFWGGGGGERERGRGGGTVEKYGKDEHVSILYNDTTRGTEYEL